MVVTRWMVMGGGTDGDNELVWLVVVVVVVEMT